MPAINALFLATVLCKAGLVPRVLPVLGLIGAPLLVGSSIAVTFGGFEQYSAPTFVFALPIALWEISLGFWLTFAGFRPSPVLAEEPSLLGTSARPFPGRRAGLAPSFRRGGTTYSSRH